MKTLVPCRRLFLLAGWVLMVFTNGSIAFGQEIGAADQPLAHPAGVAIEPRTGSIYFAERDAHRVRRLTSSGALETVAGSGPQGFSGDGGLASQAQLNSPEAVAVAATGDLYIADTGNHRIRRIQAASGMIDTIAGVGEAGFGGDGGPAVQARLVDPRALAIDPAGNLVFVDRTNQRIRSIDMRTGVISTLVGNGIQGSADEGVPGAAASLNNPAAIAFDASGNLYIADAGNQRIRVLDGVSHLVKTVPVVLEASGVSPSAVAFEPDGHLVVADQKNHVIVRSDVAGGSVSLVAGTGAQAFSGDGSDAKSALLDAPQGLAVDASGSLLIADSGNNRLRSVGPGSSVRVIRTIAGLGAGISSTLRLAGPADVLYGSGEIVVSFGPGGVASGLVTLRDVSINPPVAVGQVQLAQSTGTIELGRISAGPHRLVAELPAGSGHPLYTSSPVSITVDPLPLTAAVTSAAMLYGQTPPALPGTLDGLLPGDENVSASFHADVTSTSSPGDYPISVTLFGSAAANYTVRPSSSRLVVSKAPSSVALTSISSQPSFVTARVAASTTGRPSGTVTLSDGDLVVATGLVGKDGVWTPDMSQLSAGPHQLRVTYSGDQNFLGSTSSTMSFTVDGVSPNPATQADFSLALAGASPLVIVHAGDTATISLLVTPVNGQLAGPVMLALSGLPVSAVGNFDPPLIPPGDGSHPFTLQIVTSPAARTQHVPGSLLPLFCLLVVPLGCVRWSGGSWRALVRLSLCLLLLGPMTGCGDRVSVSGTTANASAPVTYNVVITGTATSADGKLLQHSVTVQLELTP